MPMRMLTLEDLDLKDKVVFLRVDINTPVHPETGKLIERTRLEEAAVTIRDLADARVVVASHQGRVGRPDYVSLSQHAIELQEILGKPVKFVEDVFGPTALEKMDSLAAGEDLPCPKDTRARPGMCPRRILNRPQGLADDRGLRGAGPDLRREDRRPRVEDA